MRFRRESEDLKKSIKKYVGINFFHFFEFDYFYEEEEHVKIGPSRTNKLQPFVKDAMKHAYSQEAQGNVKHRWNDSEEL